MFDKLFDLLGEYLNVKPLWVRARPYAVLAAIAVAALALAYHYIQWRYDLALDVALFLSSYITFQILLVFAGFCVVLLSFQYSPGRPDWLHFQRARDFFRVNGRAVGYRAAVVLAVAALVAVGIQRSAPARVTRIRVQFLDRAPNVRKDATAYLVYELNRRQKSWQFEFDFEDFNSDAMTTDQQDRYRGNEQRTLGLAEFAAQGQPYVALTREQLGPSKFWVHRGPVSVVSTRDRDAYAPLTDYEFVLHALIVQAMVIHLDTHGGLPPSFYERQSGSRGSVFDFQSDPQAVKSVILTSQLRPNEEALLLNRFGPEYLQTCKSLLSLDWLRSPQISGTLRKVFDVKLTTAE
jgi:hypothetical protein